MDSKKIKSVILARVSSKSQEDEGYSLDAQEKVLKDYNAKKLFKEAKLFRIAESASKDKQRKVFQEMMQYVRKNNINVIIVEKVDRFVRNFKDVVMTDDWLEGDANRQVHFVKDGIVLHKHARSQEKLNWGIRVVIAKNYIDNLKEEVAKGVNEKLAQGWLPGRPPVGYKTIGEEGKRIHVIDEEKARLVVRVFEYYLDPNASLTSTTAFAKKIGLKTSKGRALSRSHIADKVLKNKFYVGINTWCSVDYPGKQEIFLDEDVFNDVQKKITRKFAPLYRKHNPDFKDIIKCRRCGGRITWELQKGQWYGHCNYKFRNCVKVEWAVQGEVEEKLFKYFEGLVCPDPEIAAWIIETLKARHQADIYDYTEMIRGLRSQQDRHKRMLDILYEDRLAERITSERYDEKYNAFKADFNDIEDQIMKLGVRSQHSLEKGIQILESAQVAIEAYKKLSANDKRKLLSQLFSNLTLFGKELEVSYTDQAKFIAEKVAKHKHIENNFRTDNKDFHNGGQSDLKKQLQTLWLGMRDSNPRSWDQNPVPYRLANPQRNGKIIP